MFAIKIMRERAGLTQQEAADALGEKIRRYGDWEREDRQINLRDAIRVADLFKCTLDELAGRDFRAGDSLPADAREVEMQRVWRSLDPGRQDRLIETARDMEIAKSSGDTTISSEVRGA